MPRRRRRTRLAGGLTPDERWALCHEQDVGMGGLEYPFASDLEARECWRRHRATLMAEMLPGHPPCALWLHEPESFVSLESIRALRLDRQSLDHSANEFESMAAAARRNRRLDLAEQLEQRAERVRAVIAEMETANVAR